MPSKTLHNDLFIAAFQRPDRAARYLRTRLPDVLTSTVDWSRLRLMSGEFVGLPDGPRRSDLLYSVPLALPSDTTSLYIRVLLEHQSSVDPLMAFRMLEYTTRLWRREATSMAPFPVVVPLVVYHGDRPWNAAQNVADLVGAPDCVKAALQPQITQLTYLLHDLGADEQPTVPGDSAGTLTLRLLAARTAPALFDLIRRELGPALERSAQPLEEEGLLRAQIAYIIWKSNAPAREIVHHARVAGPHAEELVMNALDQLLEKGREQGREEGREQGREEGHRSGRDEERRDIARRMLAMGMTIAQVAEAALLDEATVRSLLAETPDGPIRP